MPEPLKDPKEYQNIFHWAETQKDGAIPSFGNRKNDPYEVSWLTKLTTFIEWPSDEMASYSINPGLGTALNQRLYQVRRRSFPSPLATC